MGYKLYNPHTHKMLLSRDAIFLESIFGNSELAKETGIKEQPLFTEKSETDDVVYFMTEIQKLFMKEDKNVLLKITRHRTTRQML